MNSIIHTPPKGLVRWFFRAPIILYRLNLGWILGERFLLLTHTGRKSRLPRYAVVEVVYHDRETDRYIIASGWGEKSDWLQNIMKTPQVAVKVGRRSFTATARRLSVEAAQAALYTYAQKYPVAFGELARQIVGERLPATQESCHTFAAAIPFVELAPM
ncbi:MAG: nitroreductase family deazaflavin-dependent oxidoreductase [Anaerolineales bacterium]|nr:nitroreductase family deazaflavin-dependent oxidoreductase [Anaerolineales bacterium]